MAKKFSLEKLEALGFDRSSKGSFGYVSGVGLTVRCSQCQAMCVNGVPIHEAGCPNERRELECKWCGTEFIETRGFDQSGCCSHSCWTAYSGHECDCDECSPDEDEEGFMNLDQIVDSGLCEQMTGCDNAGGFRDWARSQGYEHCKVLESTSSAGDWSFIVSKDGNEWFVMSQTNSWPRAGFERLIDDAIAWYGSGDDVLERVANFYC